MLTPLIDIIFLLVLFFVINTSFRQENYIEIQLPTSKTSDSLQSTGIVLTLLKDGTAKINDKTVEWESIADEVRQLSGEKTVKEVIIQGDELIPYESVIDALDSVRLGGAESVSLQTLK